MAKQRWCLNTKTGNVKHWNDNMEMVEDLVECNQNGVPLELVAMANKYRSYSLPDGKNAVDVVLGKEEINKEVENDEQLEDIKGANAEQIIN